MTDIVQLHLTPKELDVIAAGLGKLPMEVALPVFQTLQQQFNDAKHEAEAAAKLAAVAGAAK